MKPGLHPGQIAEISITVTSDMCPHFDSVLVHPTYATWEMVHHMEVAGRKLIAPYLEEHEEAVGTHISVDHKSPAPIGSLVTIRAEVESSTPRRLTCKTSAYCGNRLLGHGRFVQTIIPKSKLSTLLQNLSDSQST